MASLLVPFIPLGLFALLVGASGGWTRRAIVKKFGRDFVVDAAGICVLLFAGAAWGFGHPNDAGALSAAMWLLILAMPLAFLVIGAFTLSDEKPSVAAWLSYVALGVLAFAVVVGVVLYWLGSQLVGLG